DPPAGVAGQPGALGGGPGAGAAEERARRGAAAGSRLAAMVRRQHGGAAGAVAYAVSPESRAVSHRSGVARPSWAVWRRDGLYLAVIATYFATSVAVELSGMLPGAFVRIIPTDIYFWSAPLVLGTSLVY